MIFQVSVPKMKHKPTRQQKKVAKGYSSPEPDNQDSSGSEGKDIYFRLLDGNNLKFFTMLLGVYKWFSNELKSVESISRQDSGVSAVVDGVQMSWLYGEGWDEKGKLSDERRYSSSSCGLLVKIC